MTAATRPGDRLEQRISRWQHGDPEGVLDDEALVEAARLWRVEVVDAGDDSVDLALDLLARLHWARSESAPEGERHINQQWALAFFYALWHRSPIAPPPRIREYFQGAKLPTIVDIKAYASEILREIAVHALSRHRDTGILLCALSEWPLELATDAAPQLMHLALALDTRHAETSDAADLEAAVTYGERALDAAPEPDLLRASLLQNVALIYLHRFENASAISDINRCLALTNEALTITGSLSADPAMLLANRSELFANRGEARWQRYRTFEHLGDLQQAVADGKAALEGLPPGPSTAALRAHVAAMAQLVMLHPDTPPAAVAAHINALRADLADSSGDARETVRRDLGVALAHRFKHSQQIEDLQEAIGLFRTLTSRPSGLPPLLAAALRKRFTVLGDIADLDECVSLYRDAWGAASGAAERIPAAELVADVLEAEYQVRPDTARLLAAIHVGRSAMIEAWPNPATPEHDPDLLPALEQLAHKNLRRRMRAADLTNDHDFVLSDEAMTDAAYLWALAQRQTALDPTSQSLDRARCALGDFHICRYVATADSGRPHELIQAVMHWLLAQEAHPDDLPHPLDGLLGPRADPELQTNYGSELVSDAARDRHPGALNAAILLLSSASEATRAGDPELPKRLGRLSDAYLVRGMKDGNTGDLDLGVQLASEAVALAPADATAQRERLAYAENMRLRCTRRTATPDPARNRVTNLVIPRSW